MALCRLGELLSTTRAKDYFCWHINRGLIRLEDDMGIFRNEIRVVREIDIRKFINIHIVLEGATSGKTV